MTRTPSAASLLARGCMLFGKLPWAADFVRINHQHAGAVALDRWLSASHQQLALAGASWPSARVRFVYADRASASVAVGVLAASRDRAGRRFPVSAFTLLPVSALVRDYARVPLGFASFFAAAEQLLEAAAAGTREGTVAALSALAPPQLSGLHDPQAHAAPGERCAQAAAQALFADDARAAMLRAGGDLLAHAYAARERPPARACVLAAPARGDVDVALWLALAAQVLRWQDDCPSAFWTRGAASERVLLSLGPVPATLPLWLAQPQRRSERLHALGEQSRAHAHALEGLPAESWGMSADCFVAALAQMWLRTACT